jgi:putative transposase
VEAINTEISEAIEIRQVKYLNNIVEQDHRFIKKISNPMMGFKSFDSTAATLKGVELHHMLKKGQMINSKPENF